MTEHAPMSEHVSAADRLAQEIRRLRRAAELSQPQLAAKIGYSRQYVSLAERPAKGLASVELVRAIDSALRAGGVLIALRERAGRERQARRGKIIEKGVDQSKFHANSRSSDGGQESRGEEEMKRRALLRLLGTATFAPSFPDHLEQLRATLDGALGVIPDKRDADDWEEVAYRYSREAYRQPADTVLARVAIDLSEIQRRISESSGSIRRSLLHSAAQLAALLAITLVNAGEHASAERWWRTAARTATATGDTRLIALVRGRQAVLSLYNAPPGRVLDLCRATLDPATTTPGAGVMSALSARAQELAILGRHDDARVALENLAETYDRLPATDTSDPTSEWNWSLTRLHYVESHVHSHAGRVDEAVSARESAMALLPAFNWKARTQLGLHRAAAYIRAESSENGMRHLVESVRELEPWQRADGRINPIASAVLHMVPTRDRDRPSFGEARAAISPPRPPATA